MSNRIKEFQNIKEYCNKFDSFSIYDYLYFIGITNVIEDMPEEDLNFLIDKSATIHRNPNLLRQTYQN